MTDAVISIEDWDTAKPNFRSVLKLSD
jgi:hypothetical protein